MSRLMRLAAFTVACTAVLVAACSSSSPRSMTTNAPVGQRVSDKDNELALQILRQATSVATFRVRGQLTSAEFRRQDDPRFKSLFICGFPIESRGRSRGRDFARKIHDFLTDPQNFLPEGTPPSKCIFDPGVAFRLSSGPETVDIIVCFTCGELGVESTKGRLRLPTNEFYPGYSRLSALAKEAFPNDKQILALR